MEPKSFFLTLKKKLTPILFVSLISVFLFSCDDELSTVSNITVSQGTYVGLVKLTWDPVPNAQYYNIERMDANGNWINCGSPSGNEYFDHGIGMPDNQLEEGVKYKYRIISGSSDADDSDPVYADDEGWIYEMDTLSMEITKDNSGDNIITWVDLNQTKDLNIRYSRYTIERKYEDESNFSEIGTSDEFSYPHTQEISYKDWNTDPNRKATYRITGNYELKSDFDWETYHYSHTFAEKGESETGAPSTPYNITNLGSISGSVDGYGYVELKEINSEMYAATITTPSIGKPAVYKLNGTTWDNISTTYPSGLQNNFEKISIAGDGTRTWVAGVSDSAYVYELNGNWSYNLMANNMGLSAKPDDIFVEYLSNKLYALVYHDDKLEVYTYVQDSTWSLASTLESNASIAEMDFKVFNGMIYASYLTDNTLKIKHLSGTSWQDDLAFTHDYLMNICITVDTGGNIYFSAGSENMDAWPGNIFKVSSTNSATELIPSSNTWLAIPGDIAFDNSGNLVTIYTKIISISEPAEMHLAVYENSEWKEIENDYTNHIAPADIEGMNGIYYIYGDGTNTSNGYPLTLNAQKLTK